MDIANNLAEYTTENLVPNTDAVTIETENIVVLG